MPLSLSLTPSSPQLPLSIPLSAPLYLLTTICAVAAIILLAFSGDGFVSNRYDKHDSAPDIFLIVPMNALLVSALTAPVRCFGWVLSFWVRVRWVRGGEYEGAVGEGCIRLAEDDDDEEEGKDWRWKRGARKVLLSWNAWVAATLGACLGLLIWGFVEFAGGRMVRDEAGVAAVVLGADCVLHVWLAVPGVDDMEFMVLRHLFEGEDGLVDEGKGESDKGSENPGEGKGGADEVEDDEKREMNV